MTAFNIKTPVKKMTKRKAVKRITPHINLRATSVEDYLTYQKDPGTQAAVFIFVVDAIKYGISENKEVVDIFSIPGAHAHNSVISLPRKEWKAALKRAITFYASKSKFESCIDCQQLINSIK